MDNEQRGATYKRQRNGGAFTPRQVRRIYKKLRQQEAKEERDGLPRYGRLRRRYESNRAKEIRREAAEFISPFKKRRH